MCEGTVLCSPSRYLNTVMSERSLPSRSSPSGRFLPLRSSASQYLASNSGASTRLLITSRSALSSVCTNLASLWNAFSTMLLNVPYDSNSTSQYSCGWSAFFSSAASFSCTNAMTYLRSTASMGSQPSRMRDSRLYMRRKSATSLSSLPCAVERSRYSWHSICSSSRFESISTASTSLRERSSDDLSR